MRVCTRCIYDENVPGIQFDVSGVCNYCHQIETLTNQYGTGQEKGRLEFQKIVDQIRADGKDKEFDCVVGVSGGTDSSYMIAKAVEWGLRPLAVHYDNTWNTAVASQNIHRVLNKLKVPLFTHVVNNSEIVDITRAFFRANVPELDGPTDIALIETLYRAARKHRISYILEGHSFIAEGVSPLGVNYVDGGYIRDVHRRFGRLRMKTFPNMSFSAFLKWTLVHRIQRIRPFWYIDYSKEAAREYLSREFGWQNYGGHHLENRLTAFNHSVYFPRKFGVDQRNNTLSASVRAGLISRQDALDQYYKRKPFVEPGLIEYFCRRLEISREEFEKGMRSGRKYFFDYRSYKRRFEWFRPFFWVCVRLRLVPESFYLKYCFPFDRSRVEKVVRAS